MLGIAQTLPGTAGVPLEKPEHRPALEEEGALATGTLYSGERSQARLDRAPQGQVERLQGDDRSTLQHPGSKVDVDLLGVVERRESLEEMPTCNAVPFA